MATRFTDEPLHVIIAYLAAAFARGEAAELVVLDPEVGRTAYPGTALDGGIHRPWKVWFELADRLNARLSVRTGAEVRLRFELLDREHTPGRGAGNEAYGAGSGFARIKKLEDPGFVIDLREALGRARLPAAAQVLDLGVNSGDELALVYEAVPDAVVTGVDHAETALAVARVRWPGATFIQADVARPLGLGRFDLVIAIGIMQIGNLDDRALLRRLVQDHLTPTGAMIIGVPNCRYIDGEVSFGARMLNFSQPELGLVIKDIAFYRKYLQQHHLQVFVTGRNYLFVTGRSTAT
ncbi:class I SAM-dependent methyltransferase [soil metagenome]